MAVSTSQESGVFFIMFSSATWPMFSHPSTQQNNWISYPPGLFSEWIPFDVPVDPWALCGWCGPGRSIGAENQRPTASEGLLPQSLSIGSACIALRMH